MALTLSPTWERRSSATAFGERLKVRGSISANSGRAPARRMQLALAKKLNGVVMTASGLPVCRVAAVLSPNPAAARASHSASLPLAHPIAAGELQAAAAAASKAATRGPRMKLCESQTWAIASRISARSGPYWREKSSIGTDSRTGLDTQAMVQRGDD